MRIVCPTCQAAYEVPDRLLDGRAVRCARCGADWVPPAAVPAAPAAVAIPAAPAPPAVLPAPDPVPTPPPPPRSRQPPSEAAVWAAWAISVALLVVFLASAVIWRGRVMEAWPPSERLYAALGLTER